MDLFFLSCFNELYICFYYKLCFISKYSVEIITHSLIVLIIGWISKVYLENVKCKASMYPPPHLRNITSTSGVPNPIHSPSLLGSNHSPGLLVYYSLAFLYSFIPVDQLVKNPPAMQETLVQLLGREDPLEKG